MEKELATGNKEFVPSVAEEPAGVFTTPSIPKPEDFPAVGQAKIEAAAISKSQPDPAGNSPIGLFNKLKSSFGANRDEAEIDHNPIKSSEAQLPTPDLESRTSTPPMREQEQRVHDDPYAPKRPSLDGMGRINPTQKATPEEEQLDIPAFLRRQAN